MINKAELLKIFIISIVFFILIICSFNNTSMAAKKIETDILSENFTKEFDPNESGGEKLSKPFTNIIVKVTSKILNVLQILGGFAFVMSLAFAGFKGVLAQGDGIAEDLGLMVDESPNDYGNMVKGVQKFSRKTINKVVRRSVIGSILLFSTTTIVKIIINIFTSI